MSARQLYTPQLLAAAVELAGWPPRPDAPLHGAARSPACGSTLALDIMPDGAGGIGALGMRVRACAVGQAAAAVFARHASGQDLPAIAATLAALETWLKGEGAQPDWPDLALIAPARAFPGRHGAMLLPWRAAVEALSSTPDAG